MATIVKSSGNGNFPKPTTGMQQGVCTNVYGPYKESYQWGGKTITANKIIILFELEERIPEGDFKGQRFVQSVRYTASLGEKSNLRPFLVAWRGIAFTEEELIGFDLEKLIGANAFLNLIKKPKKNGQGDSVVIASIMPIKASIEKMIPELPRDYMPKWVKELLGVTTEEPEYEQPPAEHFEDDVPF